MARWTADRHLKFPRPTGDAGRDVEAIVEWRDRLLEVFATGEPLEVSARAKAVFAKRAFPERPDDGERAVVELLRWRASFFDWLSDVWDVMGEPELELDECGALQSLLDKGDADTCAFCLSGPPNHDCPFLADARTHWPPNPFETAEPEPPKMGYAGPPPPPPGVNPVFPPGLGLPSNEPPPEPSEPPRRWWQFWRRR